MPPKRRYSERLQGRNPGRPETHSDEQTTSANNSKRRRTEPQDEVSAVPSTRTSPNGDAPSATSRVELEENEVLILIGALTMRVRRETLRDAFGFFAKFSIEDFPRKFSLSCRGDPDMWSSWRLLPSEEADTDNAQEQNVDTVIAETYQTLLELVSLDLQTLRMSLKERRLIVWSGIACLLARYEATDSTKLDFSGHLLDVVVEKNLLRDHPCEMLEIGYFLKREEYFRTAMIEVVRQYHTAKSDVQCLNENVRVSVIDNVRELEIRVQKARMDIFSKLFAASHCSSILASGIILQQLMRDHGSAVFIREPTDPTVYIALRALRDWRWQRFEGRMVPEVYRQLHGHDQIVSDIRELIKEMRWREDEAADEYERQLEEGNFLSLQLVRREGQRILQEIAQLLDPIMDDDHSYFLVDPPTNYPWK